MFVLHSGKELAYIFLCPEASWSTDFKGDRSINLAQGISRQYCIQTVAWLLLAAFRQLYSEN
jgi:hypothetical protein